MTLFYRIAADVVVILHMAYVLIVVLGLPAIWFGILRRHQWVRNFWIRSGHMAMILIVVFEAWMQITCPLTIWEHRLRELAGQETYQGAFIGNLVHDMLFYDLQPWQFAVIYTVFGVLVVGSFVMCPPRGPLAAQKNRQQTNSVVK